ncbi:unnamed protein product [Diamesa serratosioi]
MVKYTAVLDIGTTTIRCIIFNDDFVIESFAKGNIELIYPQPGYVEIDPERLFSQVLELIREALKTLNITAKELLCIGISTQRSTFTTWNKKTGKVFHNFITWKDMRGNDIVQKWNNSLTLRALNMSARLIYTLTRSKRFLAGSVLKLMNNQITPRLKWVLENNSELKEAVSKNNALFGTLESFLLYRLQLGQHNPGEIITKEIEHISEITNCTATGFYDPFTLEWAGWAINMFSFKKEMLPKVVSNSHDFGFVDKTLFGHQIKISGVMADASAAMLGNCCFNKGDVKVTLGTGSFFDINTGTDCHASVLGMYPLVQWKILNQSSAMYCVEGSCSDTGSIIVWGQSIGLFEHADQSSEMAENVKDSGGVFFIPAFSGLSAPINNPNAATGFIGITPETSKQHLVRALLESIVFRVAQLYKASMEETCYKIRNIRVDGGVSVNDFICQAIADLCGITVERSVNAEATALGIAYLCALNMSQIDNTNELSKLYRSSRIFTPQPEHHEKMLKTMKKWETAVERFKNWHQN